MHCQCNILFTRSLVGRTLVSVAATYDLLLCLKVMKGDLSITPRDFGFESIDGRERAKTPPQISYLKCNISIIILLGSCIAPELGLSSICRSGS